MKKIIQISLFIICFAEAYAQNLGTRIEADYSIKEITGEGQSLIVGKVFYDQNTETLIHKQTFPRPQVLIFKDTTAYLILNDSVMRTSSSAMTVQFSVYHLLLRNEMEDFGLSKMGFQLVTVDEVGGKVVSKWKHPASDGYVAITQTGGLLDGIIFYRAKGEPLVKQYFKEHVKVGRLMVPTKIYEIVSTATGENKKVTTHTNVKIDDFKDESDIYNLFDDVVMDVLRSGKIR